MIGIKYLLFLLDPNAEKQNTLTAVEPAFDSPSAIDIVVNTVKFEKRKPVIVIGPQKELDALVKQVERLDVTKWLDLDIDARAQALMQLAKNAGLQAMKSLKDQQNTEPVFGDEVEEDLESAEVTGARRTKFSYDPDVPPENRELWDAVRKHPDWKEVLGLAKQHGYSNDEITMRAIYRTVYETICQNENKKAFGHTTELQIKDSRWSLQGQIIQGEDSASTLLQTIEEQLTHAGVLKRTSNRAHEDVVKHSDSNRYTLIHREQWTIDKDMSWKGFTSFIVRELGKKFAFHETKDKLSTKDKLGALTELELVRAGEGKVMVFIKQYLNHHQASLLTQREEESQILKQLAKYMSHWYKSGKFPALY